MQKITISVLYIIILLYYHFDFPSNPCGGLLISYASMMHPKARY